MLLYYFLTSTLKQKPVLFGPVPCVFWFLEIGSLFRTWSWALRWHLIGRAMFWTLSRARCSWLWSWSGLLWSVLVCLICLHIYMSLLMHRAGVIGYVIGYVIWPGIWSGPVLMIPCYGYDPALRSGSGPGSRLSAPVLGSRLRAYAYGLRLRYDTTA